jgi:hypothetical protein
MTKIVEIVGFFLTFATGPARINHYLSRLRRAAKRSRN